jgi:hypothetical protein
MTTLEQFLNVDDANLCASFLQNEGIDATVFEDSAYAGGLGAISSSIRVVVPNEQLEEARKVLETYKRGDDVDS